MSSNNTPSTPVLEKEKLSLDGDLAQQVQQEAEAVNPLRLV